MGKYRKKPIVIDAIPVNEALALAKGDWKALPTWLSDAYELGNILFGRDHMLIHTLEGKMYGGIDDWIIRGVNGEIYPCKPDIFEKTYEAVTP